MAVSVGTRLGPYEIVAPLGAGGMGEVYRARDTRLDRTVAVKILPSHLSNDAELKERFEREARVISSLSHPHICTLYDIGHQDGIDFLVMEFLEGDTLASRLSKGALPQDQALRYGIEIAGALDKAHRQGIVHRDLKPGNIMITKSGAKLLDFGLAKLREDVDASSSRVSELATKDRPLTEKGTVLGTIQYMAPEQLEGKEADPRTDIFAFGSILYEMITGQRAFAGQSKASLISAILTSEPKSISIIQPMSPPALDHVVRKCLSKEPDDRWQSAHDIGSELQWIAGAGSEPGATSAVTKPHPERASRIAWVVAAVMTLLAIGFAFTAWRDQRHAPEVNWTGTRLGGPDIALAPRISPDGHTLAFQAMVGENTQVAVMKPESGNWQVLTHKANAGYVTWIAWSADGNRLYFDRSADVPMGVYTVPVLGGDEKLILEDAKQPEPLPDGTLLVIKLNEHGSPQLFRFWPDSGRFQPYPLVIPQSVWGHEVLRLFPDGKEAITLARLLGAPDQAVHLYAVETETGKVRRIQTNLAEDSIRSVAPTPDNTSILVAAHSKDLIKLVIIPRTGDAPMRQLLTMGWIEQVDMAADGSVYADVQEQRQNIVKFPVNGGKATRIASLAHSNFDVLLPLTDGRVVAQQYIARVSRLVALEMGKDPVPLITTNEETAGPIAMAGPQELAFQIGSGQRRAIAVASLVNARVNRRIPFDKGQIDSLSASPDGKTLYISASGTIWAIAATGELRKICSGENVAANPDGKSLLVQVIEAPKTRLLRVPLDGSAPHEIALNGQFHMTFDPISSARISPDGRLLLVPLASLDDWFFVPGVIDLATGRMTRIVTDQSGDYHSIAWLPDGQVACLTNEVRSSIWKFTPEKTD